MLGMDLTDEEGDDKDPSSDKEPSSKGKRGFGSSSTSRAKSATTKKVVLPTVPKSTTTQEVKTSVDKELQELVKKLVSPVTRARTASNPRSKELLSQSRVVARCDDGWHESLSTSSLPRYRRER